MIIYCELNPKLTRKYKSNNFRKNVENEAEESRVYASGYGIDSVVFLRNLGANPKLITFLGGDTGEEIKVRLKAISVDFDYIPIRDENTEEILIKNKSFKTTVKTKSPRITAENRDDFLVKLSKESADRNLVCVPYIDYDAWGEHTYEDILKMCKRRGIDVALNIKDFDEVEGTKPYIAIVEKEELSRFTNTMIKTQFDVVRASKQVLKNGVDNLIVVSENGVIVGNKDGFQKVDFEKYKPNVKKINSDLMLAGIGFGFERSYDFETTIKLATAASIVENFVKFRVVSMADIKRLMTGIEIKKI
ncbi:PfkB family carbohydrate kinase [Anaerosphaera multitolerans]|uniref:Carbohydrate kinase PfkB domain-containing protein n=1 Tax=Anaerosphaera multitolerans TaxID=2487351 RepID=A0A437S718_9FIRM|nr:PfkB family carbohydrate kinase [Anaerosphaera multitolerans]RVU54823.1 hypothetical protein EF514_05750 [Anaerosphaera multitolerans]